MIPGFIIDPMPESNDGQNSTSTSSGGTTGDAPIRDIQITEFDQLEKDANNRRLTISRTRQLPLYWPLTPIHPKALILSTISSTVPGDPSTTCCVLYARTKHRLSTLPPKLPCIPRDSFNLLSPPYEIRSAGPSKKLGMFATRPLKIGDLILVEMPLIVIPIHTDLSGVKCPDIMRKQAKEYLDMGVSYAIAVELILNTAFLFGKMRKENEEAFLSLDKSFWDDLVGPQLLLSSIWRTNAFEFHGLELGNDEDRYAAVLKDSSRINHSCRPNCAHSFSPDSFTFEFRATRQIEAGEEIVYSTCDPCTPTSWRLDYLKDQQGFTCTCPSCANPDPSSDAIRVSIHSRLDSLSKAWRDIWNLSRHLDENFDLDREALKVYETSSCLARDMEQVGLDGYGLYPRALKICAHSCSLLRSRAKSKAGFEAEVRRWEEEENRITEKAILCMFASEGSYKERKRREREERGGSVLQFMF